MIKLSLSAILLSSMVCFASSTTYVTDKNVDMYKSPTPNSTPIKTLKPGEMISGTGENINGFIPIIGGYIKAKDLTPVTVEETTSKDGKSVKAIIESTFNAKELPVSYVGIVNADKVMLRNCPSTSCSSVGTKNKNDELEIVAKTVDGQWFKTDSKQYISSKYISIGQKDSYNTKDKVASLINAKVDEGMEEKQRVLNPSKQVLPKEETIHLPATVEKEPYVEVKPSVAEKSDDLYAHSGELAKKQHNEAVVRNLTKTATPIPVKIPARYARALDFPVLNKEGDVYTDYTYVWIKIKNEEFVLGNREGKNSSLSNFTINKAK